MTSPNTGPHNDLTPEDFESLAEIVGRPEGFGDPRPVPAQTHAEAALAWRNLALIANSAAVSIEESPWCDSVADAFVFLTTDALRQARGALFVLRASRGCGEP